MRRAKSDTPIDATRAPKLLDVDASDEPPEAVTNEINAATADVSPEVLTQCKRGSLDPGIGAVVARNDLLENAVLSREFRVKISFDIPTNNNNSPDNYSTRSPLLNVSWHSP